MRWLVTAVVVVLALGESARAAHRVTFAVEITPAGWRADALAEALRADLADDQLRPGTPAEVMIRGELVGSELRYAITRYGAPVRGVIELGALDRRRLAGIVKDRLHVLVKPADPDAARPGDPAELPEPGGRELAVLLVLAAMLVAPAVVARKATRGTVAGLIGLGVAAVAVVVARERLVEGSALVLAGGGLAWGAVAAVALPHALPMLGGLHRVEHHELGPVLGAWARVALVRAAMVAAAAAAGIAVLWLVGGGVVMFAVIAPIAALVVRHAVRAWVAVVAARLDERLVEGDPAWDAQVRGYVVGYLRRNNLDVDEAALAGVKFLPGKGDGVAVYGGGATHTRVVIGRALLELALAPYGRPHDYPMPRVSTLHWTHWNAGLVMPTESGDVLASQAQRTPPETVEEGEHERIALGEPPTLSGIVEPVQFDPRTTYRPGDDPLWLDWDPGEEHDGTDAGDKDFLFGVVVHALGMAERREDRLATFALAWPRLARVWRWVPSLADVYAALNGARHHLVQYLAWRVWRADALLTPRAFVPELERASRAIYARLDGRALPAAPIVAPEPAPVVAEPAPAPAPIAAEPVVVAATAVVAEPEPVPAPAPVPAPEPEPIAAEPVAAEPAPAPDPTPAADEPAPTDAIINALPVDEFRTDDFINEAADALHELATLVPMSAPDIAPPDPSLTTPPIDAPPETPTDTPTETPTETPTDTPAVAVDVDVAAPVAAAEPEPVAAAEPAAVAEPESVAEPAPPITAPPPAEPISTPPPPAEPISPPPTADELRAAREARARLVALRGFALDAPVPRTARRRVAIGVAVLAGAAAVVGLVVQAVLYHPKYEQHMTQQQQQQERASDGKRK